MCQQKETKIQREIQSMTGQISIQSFDHLLSASNSNGQMCKIQPNQVIDLKLFYKLTTISTISKQNIKLFKMSIDQVGFRFCNIKLMKIFVRYMYRDILFKIKMQNQCRLNKAKNNLISILSTESLQVTSRIKSSRGNLM